MSVNLKPDSRMLITPLVLDGATEYFDVWEPIKFPISDSDSVHKVLEFEVGRLDLLASTYYNNPSLWWVIAHANRIEDIFEEMLPGMLIRIPDFDRVRLVLNDNAG